MAGRSVSNQEIVDALRRSGMSQAEVRAQLQARGYDPSLADPYFSGASGAPSATADFVQALQSIGVIPAAMATSTTDTAKAKVGSTRPMPAPSRVFGKDVFQRASTAFDPLAAGPVDPAYRLGVGDQLQLVLTGDVELAYALDIRRDGTLILPQVGQVAIAGLTLDGARSFLRQRMAQSYSGLATGNTRLDLSISRVRTNAVFVIGEVEEPGAYQVNALATAFHALARAGGPTDRGSFRRVEVRRGGKVVSTLDLYRYLVDGDATQDVRLEQGDVIFVPLNQRAVTVAGAIRRPRQFELRADEGFTALLRYAGGTTAAAASDRVQVDRILPPEQRAPGVERVKVDVRLDGNMQRAQAFPLADGDSVTVFAVESVRRNLVTLLGAVQRPGVYEYRAGLTLDSLLRLAQGPQPYALRDRYLVQRLDTVTGRFRSLVAGGDSAPRFRLAEFDSVEVLDGRRNYPRRIVAVTGAVNKPSDTLTYLENESLRALLDRAGGFAEGALVVQVAQRRVAVEYSDTTSTLTTFDARQDFAPGGSASRFVMGPEDRVDVRLAPGFRPQRFANVSGAFRQPGTYAVLENVDRVSDLVRRAGGLLPTANVASLRLVRDSLPVAVDFTRVLAGNNRDDFPLRNGDELVVDVDPRTVRVVGAVARPSLIRWEPGRSASDYIELAGGAAERGQAHKAVVTSPAGFSRRVKRVLWTVKVSPPVPSGSTITVPAKPEKADTGGSVLATVLQVASTLASLAIALRAIQ
ncbi:MAG: SLBB domain-containing protein [Gemmatimonadetes bacterium]|nr:SLBB domain-containing protein [Gemmatimonadota bacterium]